MRDHSKLDAACPAKIMVLLSFADGRAQAALAEQLGQDRDFRIAAPDAPICGPHVLVSDGKNAAEASPEVWRLAPCIVIGAAGDLVPPVSYDLIADLLRLRARPPQADPVADLLSLADFTEKEAEVLRALGAAPSLSRMDLLRDVWGYAQEADTHTVETHVYRLRQKLAAAGRRDLIVSTEDGYRLEI